jgi:hypothetical protein
VSGFYAIRQARTRVIGSRSMTRAEADREVAAWAAEIGPARVLPVSPDLAAAVRSYDQAILVPALKGEPW